MKDTIRHFSTLVKLKCITVLFNLFFIFSPNSSFYCYLQYINLTL